MVGITYLVCWRHRHDLIMQSNEGLVSLMIPVKTTLQIDVVLRFFFAATLGADGVPNWCRLEVLWRHHVMMLVDDQLSAPYQVFHGSLMRSMLSSVHNSHSHGIQTYKGKNYREYHNKENIINWVVGKQVVRKVRDRSEGEEAAIAHCIHLSTTKKIIPGR